MCQETSNRLILTVGITRWFTCVRGAFFPGPAGEMPEDPASGNGGPDGRRIRRGPGCGSAECGSPRDSLRRGAWLPECTALGLSGTHVPIAWNTRQRERGLGRVSDERAPHRQTAWRSSPPEDIGRHTAGAFLHRCRTSGVRERYSATRTADIRPLGQWFRKFDAADNRSLKRREGDHCCRVLEARGDAVENYWSGRVGRSRVVFVPSRRQQRSNLSSTLGKGLVI